MECKVGLYCTKLGGNICGDSELRVMYGPEEALTKQYSARVCYEHKVYAGELERGRSVEATAAFESGTVDDFAVCYFWCTRDGQPPAITAALPWSDLVETAIAR